MIKYIPGDQSLWSASCFSSMTWVFHENQGSFHSDHMFLMVIYNASARWQIYCLLDDALHRDLGYMNCWAQNILLGLAGGNSYRNQSRFKYIWKLDRNRFIETSVVDLMITTVNKNQQVFWLDAMHTAGEKSEVKRGRLLCFKTLYWGMICCMEKFLVAPWSQYVLGDFYEHTWRRHFILFWVCYFPHPWCKNQHHGCCQNVDLKFSAGLFGPTCM